MNTKEKVYRNLTRTDAQKDFVALRDPGGNGKTIKFVPSRETRSVPVHIREIPLSRVSLLSGISLAEYLDAIGVKGSLVPSESLAIVLKTGDDSFVLIRPSNGDLIPLRSSRGSVIKAAVYELDPALVAQTVRHVSRCVSPSAHFLDIAYGFNFLVTQAGLGQKELSDWFHMAQPSVSNKLRLFTLPQPVRKMIAETNVPERQCRTLLNVDTVDMQLYVLSLFDRYKIGSKRAEQLSKVLKGKTVAALGREAYLALINRTLRHISNEPENYKMNYIEKLSASINGIKRSGVPLLCTRFETNDYVELTVRIPKNFSPVFSPEEISAVVALGDEPGGEDMAEAN
ncbi:MAG: hypothetical protein IJS71_04435 [Clostridia bacterium]|nr:hypothetical protein [Clostridia bacterium]